MKIDEMFGIEFPIFQGGMANIATGEFAAAVANAGAMGIIGTGAMKAVDLKAEIDKCKSLTDKPFGVNLMLMNPEVEEMAHIVAEEGVSLLTTGAGNPGKYIEMWKNAGIKIFPVVASVALARRLEDLGVDGVIAEGTESGGHIGEMTTMTLLPQVEEAVNIPVVAAGGIASPKQMAAAYILGASGIQIGTILLASEECPIHQNYKEAVLKAKPNGTIVTGRRNGAPVRILKNQMAKQYLKLENEGAELMELEKFTVGALRRAVKEGDVKYGSLMAGQVSGQVNQIKPLRQIFEELTYGANEILKEKVN